MAWKGSEAEGAHSSEMTARDDNHSVALFLFSNVTLQYRDIGLGDEYAQSSFAAATVLFFRWPSGSLGS